MGFEQVKELFDDNGWCRFNKKIARNLGKEAAIMLGVIIEQDIRWSKKNKKYNGEFYLFREKVTYDTDLSEYEQRKGEGKLKEYGVISINKRSIHGLTVRNYYFVHYDKLLDLLEMLNESEVKRFNDEDEEIEQYEKDEQASSTGLTSIGEKVASNKNRSIRIDNKEKIINKGNEKVSKIIEIYKYEYKKYYSEEIEYEDKLLQELNQLSPNKIDFLYSNISSYLDFANSDLYVKNRTDGKLFILKSPYVWEKFVKYIKNKNNRWGDAKAASDL